MKHVRLATISLVMVASMMMAACSTDDGRQMQAPTSGDVTTIGSTPNTQMTQSGWTLTAPWENGSEMNLRYTCDGEGVSPPLVWTEGPEMTRAYGVVLSVVNDPETILWAMADIPVATRNLVEGVAPEGAISGVNSSGTVGYQAPCPTAGATQQFELSVYAQEFPLELPANSPAVDIAVALDNDALDIVSTQFSYQRR
jgi:phosphatidylethanolamine-binding protein (PEBP) family uncharacterized protein